MRFYAIITSTTKKGGEDMKKFLLTLAFVIAYATFLSIGLECLLNVLGMSMAISLDGTVGEIDGIKYKIMGAAKNKVDIVFVPSANYEEAIMTKNKYGEKEKQQ